jgi:hypothetical protein
MVSSVQVFRPKFCTSFSSNHMHATFSAHLNTLIIFREAYKLWSFSNIQSLHPDSRDYFWYLLLYKCTAHLNYKSLKHVTGPMKDDRVYWLFGLKELQWKTSLPASTCFGRQRTARVHLLSNARAILGQRLKLHAIRSCECKIPASFFVCQNRKYDAVYIPKEWKQNATWINKM